MALGKQAKILTKKQIDQLIWYVGTRATALAQRSDRDVVGPCRSSGERDRWSDMVDGYGC